MKYEAARINLHKTIKHAKQMNVPDSKLSRKTKQQYASLTRKIYLKRGMEIIL
jgi:hypothetical protein